MIIFGTRPKTKTVGTGQFYCPRCQSQRAYERKQLQQYFALYFIPLIPVGKGSEFIECQTCGAAFELSVIDYKVPEPKPDLAAMINSIKPRLESGVPAEYLVRDLTALGLERDMARTMVEAQLGAERRFCAACGLTYASTITICPVCQGSLAAVLPPGNEK